MGKPLLLRNILGRYRFLVDEDISPEEVKGLRVAGHDAIWVSDKYPGWPDIELLHLARIERRIIVSCDGDFGKLVFVDNQPCPEGIIHFRNQPSNVAGKIIWGSVTCDTLRGLHTIIDDKKLRQRTYPPSALAAPRGLRADHTSIKGKQVFVADIPAILRAA